MSSESQPLLLATLSWPEVAAIRAQVELVLLPVGAIEQHGPNIALCMDSAAADEFCKRASARLYPRLLVAPAMPWGISHHHLNFPGSISLNPETFAQVLVEVVGSLQGHGFERFLIVNGHGGNVPAMNIAATRIREELEPTFIGASTYFEFGDVPLTDHAGEGETSVALELFPEMVKTDALAPGDVTPLGAGFRETMRRFGVTAPFRFDEYTRNGAFGDARAATRERGRAMVDSALDNFCGFVDELIAHTPLKR
jgi:creatinine amidohydrolase